MDRELEQLEKELEPTLNRYLSSSPSALDTKALIDQLQPEFNSITAIGKKPSFFKQLRNQWRTYPLAFWLVNIVAFALITFAFPPDTFGWEMNTYTLLIPLLLLISILYSYKSWNKEMRMVEMVTPFPPALLLYLRMFISLMMVVILGTIGTIITDFELGFSSRTPFLLTWLAPTIFIGGLLAYLSFVKEVKTGFIVASSAWLILNIESHQLYVFLHSTSRAVFYILLLTLGVAMLFVAYRKATVTIMNKGVIELNAPH